MGPAGALLQLLHLLRSPAAPRVPRGPDLLLPADTPKGARNVLGVLQAYPELGREVVAVRARAQRVLEIVGGRAIHPVFALPGGVARPITSEEAEEIRGHTQAMVALAEKFVPFFHEEVLPDPGYQSLLASPSAHLPTHYLGLVDEGAPPLLPGGGPGRVVRGTGSSAWRGRRRWGRSPSGSSPGPT